MKKQMITSELLHCLHVLTCCVTGTVSTACSSGVRLLPYLCGTEASAGPVVHPPDTGGMSTSNHFCNIWGMNTRPSRVLSE